jgi:hypothetical protein
MSNETDPAGRTHSPRHHQDRVVGHPRVLVHGVQAVQKAYERCRGGRSVLARNLAINDSCPVASDRCRIDQAACKQSSGRQEKRRARWKRCRVLSLWRTLSGEAVEVENRPGQIPEIEETDALVSQSPEVLPSLIEYPGFIAALNRYFPHPGSVRFGIVDKFAVG